MIIDVVRFMVGISLLAYAMRTDIRSREVHVYVWYLMIAAGTALLAMQYITSWFDVLHLYYLASIPVLLFIGWYGCKLKFFCEADRSAIIALAILNPFPSEYSLMVSKLPVSAGTLANSIPFLIVLSLIMYVWKHKGKDMNRYLLDGVEFPFMVSLFCGYLTAAFVGNILFI